MQKILWWWSFFHARKELYEFAQKVDAPVTDSLMGKGAFQELMRYTGMLGMHGTKGVELWSK